MSGTIIFNFDNTLVPTSSSLYYYIKKNWRHYSRWFWDPGMISEREIQRRQFYYLSEWLISKKWENITSQQYAGLQSRIIADLITGFFDSDPYDDMISTEFANRTLRNEVYTNSLNIDKIIILSNNYSEKQNKNKAEFIHNNFSNPKISYVGITPAVAKGEYLKNNNIHWNAIVEDQIPVIRNIAEVYSDLDHKEFIIPEFGYNRMPNELRLIIEQHGGIITYYNPYRNEEENGNDKTRT